MMGSKTRISGLFLAGILVASLFNVKSSPAQTQAPKSIPPDLKATFDQYCIKCHNQTAKTAGLALDKIDLTAPAANAEVLEKVIVKLRGGSMPPVGNARPEPAVYTALATNLEATLDKVWAAKP